MSVLTRREWIGLAVTVAVTALAGVTRYAGGSATLAFAVATVSLGALAWVMSFSTEELEGHVGPAGAGLLHATLGNLPELFVVFFALRAGQTVVAQSALVGSIFANALLVLGLVIVVGARASRDGVMRFGSRLPRDATTLLLLTSFIIVLAGVSSAAGDAASRHFREISAVAAVLVLIVYGSWVLVYARSHDGHEPSPDPRLGIALTMVLVLASAVGSAFVSDWFVHALGPAIRALSLSRTFAGLVIVAIAGNAVENATGIALAARGRSDLAISIVKNSVVQIASFLLPLMVLVSLLFAHALTFAFPPVYTAALALTTIAVWQVTGDGEAGTYEGLALIATYVMLATIAFYD